jgi:radical SAM enzyme (TIGR01210 family)
VKLSNLTNYPDSLSERGHWIVERRGPREFVTSEQPYLYFVEEERFANGEIGAVATVFLTNRECPWRCAMCDLWRNTLTQSVESGAIPRQILYALSRLPPARQVKLYNSGSFFDPQAIPIEDYTAIASHIAGFERVIVECHPALVGKNCFRFQQLIAGDLEVAMGLETAHPAVLEKLNKRMTLEQYATASDKLRAHGIPLRSFILLQPPFMRPEESLEWACRSIDFALDCGATAISLIPTRGGNGAMEELALSGQFVMPTLALVEDAMNYGMKLNRGRIFVDLWAIDKVGSPVCCRDARINRLKSMNLSQQSSAQRGCDFCTGSL